MKMELFKLQIYNKYNIYLLHINLHNGNVKLTKIHN